MSVFRTGSSLRVKEVVGSRRSSFNHGTLLGAKEDESFLVDTRKELERLASIVRYSVAKSSGLDQIDCLNDWTVFAFVLPGRLQASKSCGLQVTKMIVDFLALSGKMDLSDQKRKDLHSKLLDVAMKVYRSTEGEMFSLLDLVELGRTHYGLAGEIKKTFTSKSVISHLLARRPIVLAYDAELNHEPGLLSGRKAHYAAIVGFFVRSTPLFTEYVYEKHTEAPEGSVVSSVDNFVCSGADEQDQWVSLYSSDDERPSLGVFWSTLKDDDVFLICQHSRSRHLFVTPLANLRESNAQLFQDEERRETGIWNVPNDFSELRGKFYFV